MYGLHGWPTVKAVCSVWDRLKPISVGRPGDERYTLSPHPTTPKSPSSSYHHNRIFFNYRAGTGATSTSVGSLQDIRLAARMADLTPDLQVCLSWGLIAESFHSLQSSSVGCFHASWASQAHAFPQSVCERLSRLHHLSVPHVHTSVAVSPPEWGPDPQCQAAQVAHWTWWWQCLAALQCQICLITALSFRCRRCRFGCVNGRVSLAWSIALCTQELYTQPRVLKDRWREERTGSSSLNFFQAGFTRVPV